jgi:hypothetical protein
MMRVRQVNSWSIQVFECPFQVFISGGVHELIDGSRKCIQFRRRPLIVLLTSGGRKLIFTRKE